MCCTVSSDAVHESLTVFNKQEQRGLIIEAKENPTDCTFIPLFDHQKPCDHRKDSGLSLFCPGYISITDLDFIYFFTKKTIVFHHDKKERSTNLGLRPCIFFTVL